MVLLLELGLRLQFLTPKLLEALRMKCIDSIEVVLEEVVLLPNKNGILAHPTGTGVSLKSDALCVEVLPPDLSSQLSLCWYTNLQTL